MKEKIIETETIKLAVSKGFKEESSGSTTHSQLQRWLREEHNIDVSPIVNYSYGEGGKKKRTYRIGIVYLRGLSIESKFIRDSKNYYCYVEFDSYELALEEGLVEGLKLIEEA